MKTETITILENCDDLISAVRGDKTVVIQVTSAGYLALGGVGQNKYRIDFDFTKDALIAKLMLSSDLGHLVYEK